MFLYKLAELRSARARARTSLSAPMGQQICRLSTVRAAYTFNSFWVIKVNYAVYIP